MAKHFEITFVDDRDPILVTPSFADSRRFEVYLKQNPRLGDLRKNTILMLGYRCWSAATRTGALDMSFDEFCEVAADFELITPDAEPDLDEDEIDLGDMTGKGTRPGQ